VRYRTEQRGCHERRIDCVWSSGEAPRVAPQFGIKVKTTRYSLNQANQAPADSRDGRFEGAPVPIAESLFLAL
jgi:hypothetical protein